MVVHGVRAGAFDPAIWQAGTLNLLPDARHPLLEPQEGKCRNIYAPSAVQVPGGWRVFFGAWDGVPTGNDRIYSVETGDFSAFTNRHTVIEHGKFQHVCNVSAIAEGTSGFALCCTAYPDKDGLNKPAFFSSPDGLRWNGSPAPYTAQTSDIVSMTGYAGYARADINGMNVLLREDGKYRLYFCNFKDFGKIMRASGTDGRDYTYDGVALAAAGMVNDVKKFAAPDGAWYLMGIHANGPELYQSLSRDGMRFETSHTLLRHLDDADRHIVAIGWVTEGAQDERGRRVLGVLYGAGAVKSLDQNRIFARWLQKRVMFTPGLWRELRRNALPRPRQSGAAGAVCGRAGGAETLRRGRQDAAGQVAKHRAGARQGV